MFLLDSFSDEEHAEEVLAAKLTCHENVMRGITKEDRVLPHFKVLSCDDILFLRRVHSHIE